MLQLIRDRAQGFVVGVIVFFICLTFALWGVEEYMGSNASVTVAEVNGNEVELDEFQRTFQRLRQQAQIVYGDQFDSEEWSGEQAKLSTLNQVVDEQILLGLAEDSNMRISNRQVFEQIRNNERFLDENGNFSQDTYATIVGYMGFSEIGFEQQMRRDLILNQLRTGIAGSAFVTRKEARIIEQIRKQRRDIGFGIVPIETFQDETIPSDEEIEKYYQDDTDRYRISEKAALEFVTLSIEQLMKEVQPDEAALVTYYEENNGNYTQEEQRNANHILIQIKRDAPESEENAALVKANLIRAQAMETGASFEELAKENSDDVGSRTEGGETGKFGRGVMAPEFEEAVFGMAEGDISEPVRTDFGYHIIRLKEIDEGGLQSFDEARQDVEDQYRREQAEAIFYEHAEQLSELAFEQPDSLTPLADALGLEIQKTRLADRNELSLSLPTPAIAAAFTNETLVEGLNSEPVETNDGEIIVVRVIEHQPMRIAELAEVKDEIIRAIQNEKARNATKELGEKLLAELKNGAEPKTVLDVHGIEWSEETAQARESTKVNRAVIRAAFKANVEEGKEAAYIGVPFGVGDYALVKVSNISYPEGGEVITEDVAAVQNTINRNRVITDWRTFVEATREDAEVELYPGNL